MSGLPYRARPDWQVLVYQQGLGVVAGLKILESLATRRWLHYSGEVFPWGRSALLADVELSAALYGVLVAAQVLTLAVYLARRAPRVSAALLSALFLLDLQVGFENHRLLLAILLGLVSLVPVPTAAKANGFRDHRIYFNQELAAWQVCLVYLCTVAHKVNAEFVSGAVIRNLLHYVHEQGWRDLPQPLYELLQDPAVCRGLAVATLGVELGVALGLLFRRTVGYCLPLAIGMHVAFSLLMPWLWVFTALMLVVQIAFLPTRIAAGVYVLARGQDAHGPSEWVLARLWSGLVEVEAGTQPGWSLRRPDGAVLKGYEAWVELLSLSPWTFVLAEVLRIAPARAVLGASARVAEGS